MTDWKSIPIGDLVETIKSWNPLRAEPDGIFDYIDLSSIDSESKLIVGARSVACNDAPSRARQLVENGDILVSTVRPNLNGVARVVAELDGATASTGFCVLRPRKALLDGEYLFQWVKSPQFVTDMVKKSTGASYPAVSDRIVFESHIPCPPLPIQSRIATIMKQADALRVKRREALAQLDSLAQSIFIEMFEGADRGDDRWRICTVGDISDCIVPGRDKPKSFSGGVPWVTTSDLIHLGVTFDSEKGIGLNEEEIEQVNARVIPSGSVIISCVGDLGIVSISGSSMVVNQQLHSFQCHSKLNNIFLMYCLVRQKAYMLAKASSTTLPYMNKTICNSIPVFLPPLGLQQIFASRIQKIEKIRTHHNAALSELDNLFFALQQRAFIGEL